MGWICASNETLVSERVTGTSEVGFLNTYAANALKGRVSRRRLGQLAGQVIVTAMALWTGMCVISASEAADGSEPVRLIMVEAQGCRFCAQWHADIGPAYANSLEGKFAPLVRVGRDAVELQGLAPVTYTPTFIVMRGAKETGRIAGYPGKDYFWDELREVLVPAGFTPEAKSVP